MNCGCSKSNRIIKFNTLHVGQDNIYSDFQTIFKRIFLNEYCLISISDSLKYVPEGAGGGGCVGGNWHHSYTDWNDVLAPVSRQTIIWTNIYMRYST